MSRNAGDLSRLFGRGQARPSRAGYRELQAFLAEQSPDALVSSALVEVEVPRALCRSAPNALPYVETTLQLLHRLAIDEPVRAHAARFADPGLRSLVAIHLATALVLHQEIGELTHFVAYDRRLLAAAEQVAIPVASPGF